MTTERVQAVGSACFVVGGSAVYRGARRDVRGCRGRYEKTIVGGCTFLTGGKRQRARYQRDATRWTPRCTAAPQSRGLYGTGPLYVALVAAQMIPIVFPHSGIAGDVTYFSTTAVAALVLGCKRAAQDDEEVTQLLSKQAAFLAPFVASAVLFGSYLLLKYTELDIGLLLNVLTTFSGAVCFKEALDPLTSLLMEKLGAQSPRPPAGGGDGGGGGAMASDWMSLGIAVAVAAGYLTTGSYVLSNALAVGIIARVLSLVRCESFTVAVALLGGLFLYDIWWVFGSDLVFGSKVMVTVATQIDSPGKLLFPNEHSDLKYAVLGLGDVFVPGLFVNLTTALGKITGGPYFTAAVAAYAAALLGCFGVNLATNAAQPALLYLVPALIGSTLGTAALRDELPLVLQFKMGQHDDDQ